MKKILSFFIFLLLQNIFIYSQVVNLPNLEICGEGNTEIFVPINFEEINSIGAISLQVNYDPEVIEFVGYENLNSAISNPFVNVLQNPTRIAIAWFSMSGLGVNIDGKLLDLKFNYLGGETELTFSAEEIALYSGTILNVEYIDGGIISNSTPIILEQTSGDLILCEGSDLVNLSVTSEPSDVFYQWQAENENETWINLVNDNNFQGVNTDNLQINSAGSANFSNYRCKVGENCFIYSEFVSVAVLALPEINMQIPEVISLNQLPYILNEASPEGGEFSGDNVNNGIFEATEVGIYEIFYTYYDGNCTNTSSQIINVVENFRIFGKVNYPNEEETPLKNVEIIVSNENGENLYTTLSNSEGEYEILLYAIGNYTLTASFPMDWELSANSTDALLIAQYYTGITNFNNFQINIADVNGNDTVNSTDALLIQKRYISDISNFGVGDWNEIEIPFEILLENSEIEENFIASFIGDVNFSAFDDTENKKSFSNEILLISEGLVSAPFESEFNLDLKIKQDEEIGAVSMVLNYDVNLVEVLGLSSNLPNFIYNLQEDKILFSWYNVAPHNFVMNENIFTLHLKAKTSYSNNEIFQLGNSCEFAGADALEIENIILSLPSINIFSDIKDIEKMKNNEFKISPNPFFKELKIGYSINSNSEISLKITDITGKKLLYAFEKELVKKGDYEYTLNLENLQKGVYFAVLEIKNKNSTLKKVKKIIKL